jgi:hypothetical protein
VIGVGSTIIALIFSHGAQWEERIANALIITICLFFVNSFVAFGGCALIGAGAPNHGPYELAPPRVDSGARTSPVEQ